jgi:hypothetical protein
MALLPIHPLPKTHISGSGILPDDEDAALTNDATANRVGGLRWHWRMNPAASSLNNLNFIIVTSTSPSIWLRNPLAPDTGVRLSLH